MLNRTNSKRIVIPIKNTKTSDLNEPEHVPEREHKYFISFLCVMTSFIAALFCCITV